MSVEGKTKQAGTLIVTFCRLISDKKFSLKLNEEKRISFLEKRDMMIDNTPQLTQEA